MMDDGRKGSVQHHLKPSALTPWGNRAVEGWDSEETLHPSGRNFWPIGVKIIILISFLGHFFSCYLKYHM